MQWAWVSFGKEQIEEESWIEERTDEENMAITFCQACKGTRLNLFALSVKIKNKNIAQLSSLSIEELSVFCANLKFPTRYKIVADKILEKIQSDLSFFKKNGFRISEFRSPCSDFVGRGSTKDSAYVSDFLSINRCIICTG